MRPENRAHRLVLIYSATATAVVVVGITAIAEAAAEEQDYDKDDNPRSSAAAVVTTATHDRTSLRFSKSYYEKQRKVLLLVIPTRDYYKVTEGIKLIDPGVFFVVEDAYEVKGGK